MPRLVPVSALIALALLAGCASAPELPRLEGDWTGSRLPGAPYTHLVFRGYHGAFRIALDGQPVYTFHDPAAAGRVRVHVVALPPASAARQLSVIAGAEEIRVGAEAILATPATLPRALVEVHLVALRRQGANILLGLVIIVTGLVALFARAVRRRYTGAISLLGAFMLLYGTRAIVDSYLPLFLGASLQQRAFADSFLTYVIPLPGWLVALQLLGRGWRSTIWWQVVVFALFAPIGIASDLITGRPESLDAVNNLLVIAGGVNIIFNTVESQRRDRPEMRIALTGSVVFMLFALGNNLAALSRVSWRFDAEPVGLLIFVTTLGYAASVTFAREEREQVAMQNELTTAREIQRAILPVGMPDVAGLRFQTVYEPATSVAGDMYDFLRVDESHAGVLVADVAGHGVPAALIASMVKIAASSQSARLASDPAAMLSEMNAILRAEVRRAFVTATYLWFDMNARTVSVCNAGHPPPLLLRNGEFHELGGAGVLLGRFAAAPYAAKTTKLEPGDRIIAYTDGITEARNAEDEQLGEERLRELFARGGVPELMAAVHRWRTSEDADDLTIVAIDVTS